MSRLLDDVLRDQKSGKSVGIPSICSSHPYVLKTALQGENTVLVESTCNQVNQFGGYSGMNPADFALMVRSLASQNGFPLEHLVLGGDHLGPLPWQSQPADSAMANAGELVRLYVQAGFTKIHIDASMKLGDDDPSRPLEAELAAQRTASLVHAAEAKAGPGNGLRYVVGSEVPTAGGATVHEEKVAITTVESASLTLEAMQKAFKEAGVDSAWEKVVALVVQPGVEFGNDFVLEYAPFAAENLARFAGTMPFIFEAHSSDYQQRSSLQYLVRDHFAILKVGPALTFAFREAIFGLALIEEELVPEQDRSHIVQVLETAMLKNPRHWQTHYPGTTVEQAHARKFSRSDRIRYYWPEPAVQAALQKLLMNLKDRSLPLPLLDQFLPDVHDAIYSGRLKNMAGDIISYKIKNVLDDYSAACDPSDSDETQS
jgi:D-tagatose-1,6-bisphosphate aldolase subunit GatZ/KbaZ